MINNRLFIQEEAWQIPGHVDIYLNKKSDTLCIMGSAWSINNITPEEWFFIESHDSIGFNWFCKSGRKTTFYLVREQCTQPMRVSAGRSIEDFIEGLKKSGATLIVKNKGVGDQYSWINNFDKLPGAKVIIDESGAKVSPKNFMAGSMLITGIIHGKCTLIDCLHFAVQMQYANVILFGIDLIDYRYFWEPWDHDDELVLRKGFTRDTPHPTQRHAIDAVLTVLRCGLDVKVHNPASVLADFIPVWKL